MSNSTVLIIEDEHDIRVALRETLESSNFKVLSTTNGVDALALLKTIPAPHLIILDLKLPLMGGQEFLGKLKGDPQLSSIPVLVLSAHLETSEPPPGALYAVRKPVDGPRLVRTIQACLKQQSELTS